MSTQVQKLAPVEEIARELAASARALERPGGDEPDLRSLRDVVQRLQRVVGMVARQLPGEPADVASKSPVEFFVVPDVEYGYDFWRDADDEGICGHRPAQ